MVRDQDQHMVLTKLLIWTASQPVADQIAKAVVWESECHSG